MIKINKQRISSLVGLAAVAAIIAAPVLAPTVNAVTASSTINATVSPTISITGGTTLAIGVAPTATAAMSSVSDSVSVTTNDSLGYTLKLSDTDTNTNLVSGANNIAADAGTQASPSASLTTNAWGYRVDGVGGFTAGPTSAETNVTSSAYKWAGVPSSASANTIKTTATTASADATTFWYGVKVDNTKPSGVYTDSVTYTATAN